MSDRGYLFNKRRTFNDTFVNVPPIFNLKYKLNFISNSVRYSSISFMKMITHCEIYYDTTKVAHIGNTNFINAFISWVNSEYRTIEIIGGVANADSDFVSFILNNTTNSNKPDVSYDLLRIYHKTGTYSVKAKAIDLNEYIFDSDFSNTVSYNVVSDIYSRFGTDKIKSVCIGTEEIERVYMGSSVVFNSNRDVNVSGKSFKVNEIVQDNDTRSEEYFTYNGVTVTLLGNRTYKLNGTATAGNTWLLAQNINFLSSHYYYFHRKVISGTATFSNPSTNNCGVCSRCILDTHKNLGINDNSLIGKPNSDTTGFALCFLPNNSDVFNDYVIQCSIIDLTLAFGSGNEPTTIAEFNATDFGKYLNKVGYISYTEGSIIDSQSPLEFSNSDGTKIQTFAPTSAITLKSAGTAHDTYRNTSGKKTKVIESVDLGTLTWNINNQEQGCFWTDSLQGTMAYQSPNSISNLICNKYTTIAKYGSPSMYSWTLDKVVCGDNRNIIIRDTDFIGKTTAEVKTLLSGVILNYELETSVEEQSTSIILSKKITKCTDSHGIELTIVNA